jgi:hypothetical protein
MTHLQDCCVWLPLLLLKMAISVAHLHIFSSRFTLMERAVASAIKFSQKFMVRLERTKALKAEKRERKTLSAFSFHHLEHSIASAN